MENKELKNTIKNAEELLKEYEDQATETSEHHDSYSVHVRDESSDCCC